MRLWHIDLIKKLPRQQLLGQWRECLALLGKGWGKKHSTVDYVFKYSDKKLMNYTDKVFIEMIRRGYNPNANRITEALQRRYNFSYDDAVIMYSESITETRYSEHNNEYLEECITNLENKRN